MIRVFVVSGLAVVFITGLGLISGADDGYSEIYGGDMSEGRWFTKAEMAAGSAVVVLESDVVTKLFGAMNPIDKWVRVGGRPARVIGVYQEASNIFEPPVRQAVSLTGNSSSSLARPCLR